MGGFAAVTQSYVRIELSPCHKIMARTLFLGVVGELDSVVYNA